MPDATDVPATGGEPASAASESITTEPGGALPPLSEPEPYRPLSLLAITALGIAAVYSAIIVFGGLFAIFTRTHWLLPTWTFGLPLLAAGAALIARFQIRRSEGTQSGLALTVWTFGLAFGVGFVLYGSYYLATYVRVRWQAQTFAEQWLKTVAQGKTEAAFFETTKPPRKIVLSPGDDNEDVALRRMLELVHNTSNDPARRAPFSGFSSLEFVRLLQAAGPDTKIELEGVKDWGYEKGGFSVTLAYRVTTDLASLPVQVKVLSAESGGRQWQVLMEATGVSAETTFEFYTDKGKRFRLQNQIAESLAAAWVQALSRGDVDNACLATLDAKDRERYMPCPARFALGSAPAGLEYLQERRRFVAGGLVSAGKTEFWAPDQELGKQSESEAKALFDPTPQKPRTIRLNTGGFPKVTVDDKGLHLGYDVQILGKSKKDDDPPVVIEGRVVVGAGVAETSKERISPDSWRIEALELVRGRNMAQPQGPTAPPQRRDGLGGR
jgi:hypothetical protein